MGTGRRGQAPGHCDRRGLERRAGTAGRGLSRADGRHGSVRQRRTLRSRSSTPVWARAARPHAPERSAARRSAPRVPGWRTASGGGPGRRAERDGPQRAEARRHAHRPRRRATGRTWRCAGYRPTARRSASRRPTSARSTLADRTVDTGSGITHLRYRQSYRGIPTFDSGLRVNLDRGGRILNVTGAPVSGLRVASVDAEARRRRGAAGAPAQRRRGSARSRSRPAPSGARRVTRFARGDFARLVLFGAADGPRLAWHVTYRANSLALL